MTTFLWWSGVVAWFVVGIAGVLAFSDLAIDWFVDTLRLKREFMAFIWDRMKARSRP